MDRSSLFGVFLIALAKAASAQEGGTTRYWDCCKPSCSWNGKGPLSRPVLTCEKNGATKQSDPGLQTGCNNGPAFTCNDYQPWAVSDTLSYGFAAAKLQGMGETDWCCGCYELSFTSTSLANRKKMLVQVTNTGGDLNGWPNHFDLQIPGGGVGLYDGCTPQWGRAWGNQYGGVSSREECLNLPSQIRDGCYWRFDWFEGANNPTMTMKRYKCPAALTSKTGCVRSDEWKYPDYPGTTPSGDITWQTGADGVWALQCDFKGQDLSNTPSTGEQCSGKCKAAAGCTHYTWTSFNGGTCWMKSGAAAKTDAFKISDSGAVCGINTNSNSGISWNGNWAFGCDFKGQDLQSRSTSGSQCGGTCKDTSGCTHFTWTNYNGGTCWMKQGAATKSDAFSTGDNNMVCGFP